MSWKRLALLPLVIALASCSMDGGSSGTGITTAEGNVAGIQRDQMMGSDVTTSTRTAVEGIQVVVEGTDAAGETDSDGRFVARGTFNGHGTLLFRRADDDLMARMDINVPAGGTLTLHDVQIDLPQEQALAASQDVVFDALVSGTDCTRQALYLASLQNADGDATYTLHLETSSLRDRHGNPVACGDVQDGDRVHVQGAAYRDGTFGAAEVQVHS
jgi:hypothetical protein